MVRSSTVCHDQYVALIVCHTAPAEHTSQMPFPAKATMTPVTPLRADRASPGALLVVLAVFGLTACTPLGDISSGPDSWRAVAEEVAARVTSRATTDQTIAPDPATFGAPPLQVSGIAEVPATATELRRIVEEAAAAENLEDARCVDITRARARELLVQQPDTLPDVGSVLCNLYSAGETFGFVVLSGQDPQTTRVWYSIGPDAGSQKP